MSVQALVQCRLSFPAAGLGLACSGPMRHSRRICGAILVLLLAFLLSPKIMPPGWLDHALEALLDYAAPVTIVEPKVARNLSGTWTDILAPRPPGCPVVYRSCKVAHSFVPRPTDVIITSPPKAGTTFMQQMTHQIRTGGDMNFTDIYDVSPWILVNPLYSGDAANVVQPWQPRLFKNHQPLSEFQAGRHIVLVRDPATIFQSTYKFCSDKRLPFMRHNAILHIALSIMGLPESVVELLAGHTWKDECDFARSSIGWRRNMGFGVNIFHYISEFWHARHDPNVLFLCYEDVASNRERWIPVVGRFMGIEMTADLVQRVFEMTSKEFMLEHIQKFDESQIADRINEKGNVKMKWLASPRISQTKHKELSPELQDLIHREWVQQVGRTTGFASYAELRAAWLAEVE